MYTDDPLESWLRFKAIDLPPAIAERAYAGARVMLDGLASMLDNSFSKGTNMMDADRSGWSGKPLLAPADVPRAQDLYRRIFEAGGAGNVLMQEILLNLIAEAEDPVSIPFWSGLPDLSRPRDTFAEQRRTIALAALARLAIRRRAPEAITALRDATRHSKPEVRALAVYYLGRAFLWNKQALPPEVQAELAAIAANDRAFAPRFLARSILREIGQPVPLDNPGGVYAFKVKFSWNKRINRTIELRSEQTLTTLHAAIQRAIDWDSDHLYSFHMNGRRGDRRYTFASPYQEDRRPHTTEAVIGELGLVLKHTFMYLFDYGDNHTFDVEVVGIYPRAEHDTYPRVAASQGEAPAQYYYGDEEEEDEQI